MTKIYRGSLALASGLVALTFRAGAQAAPALLLGHAGLRAR
jgi:hypothetical protein